MLIYANEYIYDDYKPSAIVKESHFYIDSIF